MYRLIVPIIMENNKTEPIQCLLGKKIGYPELINVFYTALLIFLVFTAANDLVKGLIRVFSVELFLYLLLWLSMVIQTTFAYWHIREVSENYELSAFLSDCVDICIFIYVCAAIGSTYDSTTKVFDDLDTYWHISIPFIILSFNQVCWYIFVKEKKAAAILRLILLFIVMLTATILDNKYHGVGMLATIVLGNFFIMVILRAINRASKRLEEMMDEKNRRTIHRVSSET